MSVCILGGGFISKNLARYFGSKSRVVRQSELDLTNVLSVNDFFMNNEFEYVILCATVGGSRLVPDPPDTVEKNVRMYMNVSSNSRKFKKMIWFSSGAAYYKETSAYGLSKFIQERLCTTANENIYGLRIFGCFGPDENSSRFLSTCVREGHVDIDEDRYFDFFDVHDLGRVIDYIFENEISQKIIDAVYPSLYKLSDLAKMVGATGTFKKNTERKYTGSKCDLNFMKFEPLPLLLQNFREDYIRSQRQSGTCRDGPQEGTPPP